METRVNWRMEYEMQAWILRQEYQAAMVKKEELPTPILDLLISRDEVVRAILTEIETHDGLFGSSSAPESIL